MIAGILPTSRVSRAVSVLSGALSILLLVTSVAGLVFGTRGFYRPDPATMPTFIGQDALSLVIGLPLLIGSMRLALRGSLRALLLWAGALFYFAYSYSYYVLSPEFNALYPAYLAIVSMSLYGLVALLLSVDAEAVRARFAARTPVHVIGGFMMFMSLLLALKWMGGILGALQAGVTPAHKDVVVWSLDLAIALPALFWAGAWLWRRQSLGFVVAGLMLLKAAFVGITLVVDSYLVTLWGESLDPMLPAYAAIGLGGLALLVVYLRAVLPVTVRRRDDGRAHLSMPASQRIGQDTSRGSVQPLRARQTHWRMDMQMNQVMHITLSLAVLLIASVGASLPAAAQGTGRSVAWQRFDVDLAIQSDGSVNVVETQVIRFTGTYQQGYRLVPLDRTTDASNVRVAELTNNGSLAYTRGSGQIDTYSTSTTADGLEIDWWFSPTPTPTPTTNTTRSFEIRYTVSGVVRVYDAADQLQWRAVYAERDGPVGSSTVTVHLPTDADASTMKSAWYQYSASGSVGALTAVASGTLVDSRTVQFALRELPPRQGAEVRVQFPHGAISGGPPVWQAQADREDWLQQSVGPIADFVALLLTLAILGGGGALLFFVWYSNGRDPSIGAVPSELDAPPSSLPAPVAGTLVHEGASQREAVATLVDLADRGMVHLLDEQHPQLIRSHADVRITLDTTLTDDHLRGYERELLIALFGSSPKKNAEVLLSTVKTQFQSSISSIEKRLSEAVVEQGFFSRNPRTTRIRWAVLGSIIVVAGLGLAAGGMALSAIMHVGWLPGLALVIIGSACIAIGGAMPRKTQQGALEAAKWRAFAAHLRQVSHGERHGTALLAHYLPYAVAFGTDESFLRHLESVGAEPPAWYGQRGPGGIIIMPGGWYGGRWMGPPHDGGSTHPSGGVAAPPAPNPQAWSGALAALLNAASQAMSHGGGSGGWSGGGFGGGGGGGGGSGGFR